MIQTGSPLGSKLVVLLAGALALMPGAAAAQDSFVREADFLTGRPLLSVLGSGVGQLPASLMLEFSCPGMRAGASTCAARASRMARRSRSTWAARAAAGTRCAC